MTDTPAPTTISAVRLQQALAWEQVVVALGPFSVSSEDKSKTGAENVCDHIRVLQQERRRNDILVHDLKVAKDRIETLLEERDKALQDVEEMKKCDIAMSEEHSRLQRELDKVIGEVDRLNEDRDHWKANHDHMKAIKQAVLERPDLEDRAAKVQQLVADLDEETALRERLADLLTQTAAALKGPPPEGTLHDWSDLPKVAAAHREALRRVLSHCDRTSDRETQYERDVDDARKVLSLDTSALAELAAEDAIELLRRLVQSRGTSRSFAGYTESIVTLSNPDWLRAEKLSKS